MRNPCLVGTKVYLRPLEEADAAECHVWLNDPDVRRTLAVRGVPHTEASSRAWLRALDPRRDQVFAIVTNGGRLYVGNCGLHDIDPVDRHATLGIVIGRKDRWGQGFGTETVRLLCRHAFDAGDAVGTARLRETEGGRVKAERVAVRRSVRRSGIGRALMRALEDEVRARGHRELVLNAQVAVIAFYERLGYRVEGPEFLEAGIPHRAMRKPLT